MFRHAVPYDLHVPQDSLHPKLVLVKVYTAAESQMRHIQNIPKTGNFYSRSWEVIAVCKKEV